jgi:8-oxo-dGTP diphosphatase
LAAPALVGVVMVRKLGSGPSPTQNLDAGGATREPRHVPPDDEVEDDAVFQVPRIPASAGALIFDAARRLLVLKPTYKSGWTVPGGQMEDDGETPWEACRREVQEETGLVVDAGRLVCVDFLRPRPGKPGGIRFLFDCGVLDDRTLAAIEVQQGEISEYRLEDLAVALELLSGPLRRRVGAAAGALGAVYLEDGRPMAPPRD